MRKELFEAIKAKIESTLPEILHVDLWNHNVEYIEEETPWARPAVFVEFGAISWQPLQGGGRRGSGVVRLHLVTDWAEGEYATAFALWHGADGDGHKPQSRGYPGERGHLRGEV